MKSSAASSIHPAPVENPGVTIDCGWGRLLFGQTFASNEAICAALREEGPGQRDIALYIDDPHVLLAIGPQDFFLDPSHTYRVALHEVAPVPSANRGRAFTVRRVESVADAVAVNAIYARRKMVTIDPEFVLSQRASRILSFFVAEDAQTGDIIGAVTGIDHHEAFADPQNGASLWSLAVDPQTSLPGVGQELVTHLIAYYAKRGRDFWICR